MTRTELINYFIHHRNYSRYLEVGVYNQYCNFHYINCCHKVGVDTRPVTTFCGTSDEFFVINEETFDLIFIDGLHTEEQVLKDIDNAFKCLTAGGIIILHDCMPPDAWHQREPEEFCEGENWNGTVWKATLRVFNQTEHKCMLLDTDWGCGIIDTAQKQTPLKRELPATLSYEQHYTWFLDYKIGVADYLQQQVKVFYHLACMGNWQEVFMEQMGQLQQNNFREINLTMLGTEEDWQVVQLFCDRLGLHLNLVFRDSDLKNYERPAMLAIEKYAKENEGYVLYLHSKGVSNPDASVKVNWRRLMMQELVDDWEHCILQLPNYDVIGVNWHDPSCFSGNFWYTSTRYLRQLPDFSQYYANTHLGIPDLFDSKRLACEFWIGTSAAPPRVLSLVCRNVNFYLCTDEFWEMHLPLVN